MLITRFEGAKYHCLLFSVDGFWAELKPVLAAVGTMGVGRLSTARAAHFGAHLEIIVRTQQLTKRADCGHPQQYTPRVAVPR